MPKKETRILCLHKLNIEYNYKKKFSLQNEYIKKMLICFGAILFTKIF